MEEKKGKKEASPKCPWTKEEIQACPWDRKSLYQILRCWDLTNLNFQKLIEPFENKTIEKLSSFIKKLSSNHERALRAQIHEYFLLGECFSIPFIGKKLEMEILTPEDINFKQKRIAGNKIEWTGEVEVYITDGELECLKSHLKQEDLDGNWVKIDTENLFILMRKTEESNIRGTSLFANEGLPLFKMNKEEGLNDLRKMEEILYRGTTKEELVEKESSILVDKIIMGWQKVWFGKENKLSACCKAELKKGKFAIYNEIELVCSKCGNKVDKDGKLPYGYSNSSNQKNAPINKIPLRGMSEKIDKMLRTKGGKDINKDWAKDLVSQVGDMRTEKGKIPKLCISSVKLSPDRQIDKLFRKPIRNRINKNRKKFSDLLANNKGRKGGK